MRAGGPGYPWQHREPFKHGGGGGQFNRADEFLEYLQDNDGLDECWALWDSFRNNEALAGRFVALK